MDGFTGSEPYAKHSLLLGPWPQPSDRVITGHRQNLESKAFRPVKTRDGSPWPTGFNWLQAVAVTNRSHPYRGQIVGALGIVPRYPLTTLACCQHGSLPCRSPRTNRPRGMICICNNKKQQDMQQEGYKSGTLGISRSIYESLITIFKKSALGIILRQYSSKMKIALTDQFECKSFEAF